MSRSKARIIIAFAVVSMFAALPAKAFFFTPDGQTLIRTDALIGNAAISYRIHVPAGGADITVGAEGFGSGIGNTGFGIFSSFFGFAVTGYNGKSYTHVEGPAIGTVLDQRGGGYTCNPCGAGAGTHYDEGDYTITVVATADGAMTGDAVIFASNLAVSVTNTTLGSGFMYREPDFRGGVNVDVLSGEAGAKAIVGSSVSQTVSGQLFGIFEDTLFDPIATISYDEPSGVKHSASAGGVFFYEGDAPGPYTFNIDANVGATGLAGIFAWGGDIVPA
ncbi:MAG: hypothetical protein ABR552_07820 [Actinomycetota bacterium]